LPFYPGTKLCPRCGRPGKCFARETSESIHYYDEYTFQCLHCDCIIREEKEKGSTISGVKITTCPFCGKIPKEHERPSKELIQSPAKSLRDFF